LPLDSKGLIESENDWALSLHGVDVVYVDFGKAYDCVVHSKLIHKLQSSFKQVISDVRHGSVFLFCYTLVIVDNETTTYM